MSLYLFLEIREKMTEIGKQDIKGRHYPRSYAIWAASSWNVNHSEILTVQKSHHHSEPCEDQHKFICQRPAAASDGSEALG